MSQGEGKKGGALVNNSNACKYSDWVGDGDVVVVMVVKVMW